MTAAGGEPWVTIATSTSEADAAELALVLAARGVEHRRVHLPEGWSLAVPQRQAALASEELAEYRSELSGSRPVQRRPLLVVGNGWPGVLVYSGVLMLVATAVQQSALGLDWLGVGRMDAGRMTGGEWWRAVTALTLHLEPDHLLGNLVFGGFFAYFAARYLGTGFAWAGILAAGTLGNVLNGLVQSPDHRSIGASTAVFGALGLLSAFTWRRRLTPDATMRARVAPLVAGVALLAYTGTGGANTDIGAHLTGFVAGVVLGVGFARLDLPVARETEAAAGAAACALVAAAWAWGFAVAG